MDNQVLRIDKLENGYEVSICDPKIMEANAKSKGRYQEPWKDYAFRDVEGVKQFIGEHLDSLKPPPDADTEYSSAFAEATKEDNEE